MSILKTDRVHPSCDLNVITSVLINECPLIKVECPITGDGIRYYEPYGDGIFRAISNVNVQDRSFYIKLSPVDKPPKDHPLYALYNGSIYLYTDMAGNEAPIIKYTIIKS